MRAASLVGSRAIFESEFHLAEELAALLARGQRRLRQRGALALWAQVKMRAALLQIEVEAEFFGHHHLEIFDLHLRRELLPGMRTDPKGIQIRKRITVIAWVTAMNG
jgi:hypothetical protein